MRNAWFVKRFFYRGKFIKKEERKSSIALLLLPSILGICLCLICVCGLTWAWFSVSVEIPTQSMTAAYYGVQVESIANETETIPPTGGGYSLTAGQTYIVTLQASGTVQNCGGYCLIAHDGTPAFYTQTFKPGETITFTIQPQITGVYTFSGVWGSLPSGVEFIRDGDITPTEPEPAPTETTAENVEPSESTTNVPAESTAPSEAATTDSSAGTPSEPTAAPTPDVEETSAGNADTSAQPDFSNGEADA